MTGRQQTDALRRLNAIRNALDNVIREVDFPLSTVSVEGVTARITKLRQEVAALWAEWCSGNPSPVTPLPEVTAEEKPERVPVSIQKKETK